MKHTRAIGIAILTHWLLLAIERTASGIAYNLFWTSHLALLLSAVAFIKKSNLLLSGALISILIGHSLWLFDFAVLTITGNQLLNYPPNLYEASLIKALVTSHHFYLLALLIAATWRNVHDKAWMIAAGVLATGLFLSYFFAPEETNINCAHFVCEPVIKLFPFLDVQLPAALHLIASFALTTMIAFWIPNKLLTLPEQSRANS